jgi:hypothetical protein
MVLSLLACNPYRSYFFTHYHIIADYDPASTLLSANVQMVFIAGQEYHDSIAFRLKELVEIQSLTAQELKYYEFEDGRLVLFIEDAVMPGDQLHISLSYAGHIGNDQATQSGSVPKKPSSAGPVQFQVLSPDRLWYPVNADIKQMTYSVEIELPDAYSLEGSGERKGRNWLVTSAMPVGYIAIYPIIE